MVMMTMLNSQELKAQAKALGFDDCGVADPALEADDGLDAWLARGCHNGMDWLEKSRDKRQQIRLLLPGVQSVIVVAANYFHSLENSVSPARARIARYAWRRDYHRVMMPRLKQLAGWIREQVPDAACYCSVDTAPVRERPWAMRAGLGWIGRHSLLLHPLYGSWVHLGVILTTAAFEADRPLADGCGSCRRCIELCPTKAITAGRSIDTNICIACQSIERKEGALSIPLHGWAFGCDLCQEVCPMNHKLQREDSRLEAPRSSFAGLSHEEILALTEDAFLKRFAGTPVMRAGYEALRRNARQAIDVPSLSNGEEKRGTHLP